MNDKKVCKTNCDSAADLLNRACFCKTLNRAELLVSLQAQALPAEVLQHLEQLFSHTAVFISPTQWQQLQRLVHAITRVTALSAYQQAALAKAPAIAQHASTVSGVFMGFDFHLNESGPQVIEINTNAGGGFLNAILLSAQTACCNAAGTFPQLLQPQVESEFVAMFKREWQLARGDQTLRCIALVDENPSAQFLYPEFLLAQSVFERAGIKTLIVDPRELSLVDGKLFYQQQMIDLVYNRLTDFSLTQPGNAVLRSAYENNAIVLTPNPRHHALYADKRNLVLLSDETNLREFGTSGDDIKTLLAGIPRTQLVSADNAEHLWQERKHLFFKPATGYGSKAAYRGDKITKRVWDEILQGDYVAQQQIPPSERGILVDEQEIALKMDIRAYVYAGEIQLLAARLYQGQTTNFRTQGGGFAPVFVAE
ncbi:hypothetical protein [Cellvibrio fibrivorans]|uniref:Circularly permuted type 2 ATP-grasp protein n=1 Tax=Cellvibrio fibrivorans TaxID=126350 RepID=A0ABU1V1V7_9GAMM|nr:hypothetical protein [Cellvibrio fibrivorans]MDR7091390.1 hypothetical protein [Cellvibrio fibrivorans]